ncbi:MAG TPA: PadR family transcriptional regulator [Candidatus Bathyarchaeia archaeon]|nr:PadR family transcriptional regulator [Candidatus Bathyarchaeia archaeon]
MYIRNAMFAQNVEENQRTARWLKEAQKGYIRVAVLILLNRKPAHGYEIMKEIKDRTKGFWKPTAGGVYPILLDLEKARYVEGEWSTQNNRKIKVYKITETGRTILRNAIVKQNEIANNMNTLFGEFARDVLNLEQTTLPFPIMPTPFSPFLEEKDRESEDKTEDLERKRIDLKRMIKMLQDELQTTNKRLAKAK